MLRLASSHRIARLFAIVGGAVATLVAGALGSAVQAQDLIVKYDQAAIVRLPRPAAEIIIGNPSIADVTIQSGTSLVITGKSFGVTNIIALDAMGQIIRDHRLMVRLDDERTVSLMKGTAKESYACTPNCQPTLTIGDDTAYFKKVQDSVRTKAATAESGGSGGGGQGGAQ
jgi:Flp pilus assembly secretin CpaC